MEGSNGTVKIASSNAGKEFAAEEISAQVLRKLVDDASKFLNDKVRTREIATKKLCMPIRAQLLYICALAPGPVITDSLGVRGRRT